MRLINPGAGEITDRLTILALKVLHGQQEGKDTKHFEAEQSSLLVQIRTRSLNGNWFEQALALAATNGALWDAEDDLRQLRVTAGDVTTGTKITDLRFDLTAAVNLAFRIQALNDARAQLIATINKQTGENLGSEKL